MIDVNYLIVILQFSNDIIQHNISTPIIQLVFIHITSNTHGFGTYNYVNNKILTYSATVF